MKGAFSTKIIYPRVCGINVHKNSKASSDLILDSINGTDLTPAQKSRIELVNDHIKQLSSNIQRLDKLIDLMIESYEDYISFLCQIPGVSRNSAITILSEIGVDMNQFTSTRRLTSWAGLTPSSNQSAEKNLYAFPEPEYILNHVWLKLHMQQSRIQTILTTPTNLIRFQNDVERSVLILQLPEKYL